VLLVVGARGEEERFGRLMLEPVAEGEAPQTVDHERLSGSPLEFAEESPGGGIVRADRPVAEVADQETIAENAKSGGSDREGPRRVQPVTRDDPADELAVGVEHVDEAEACSRDVVVLGLVLFRISDP